MCVIMIFLTENRETVRADRGLQGLANTTTINKTSKIDIIGSAHRSNQQPAMTTPIPSCIIVIPTTLATARKKLASSWSGVNLLSLTAVLSIHQIIKVSLPPLKIE
jgi:hypothetical protein